MSRKDAVLLASRTLAVLLIVWALTDLSYPAGAVTLISSLPQQCARIVDRR